LVVRLRLTPKRATRDDTATSPNRTLVLSRHPLARQWV
jgi:hypothetical protein